MNTLTKVDRIFVFGSNESGIHGAGAAAYAVRHFGAIPYQPVGKQGYSYAIPTKAKNVIDSLPVTKIKAYVDEFLKFAKENQLLQFQVTRIGCGHAGFTDEQMAPLFKDAPSNCLFDSAWQSFLPDKKFWGTF